MVDKIFSQAFYCSRFFFFYLFAFVVGVVNVTPFYFAGFLFISVLFAR